MKLNWKQQSAYRSVARGNVTRLNSQVMMGGGCATVLQENLATEPSVATIDVGWTENEEIPATKPTRRQIRDLLCMQKYRELMYIIKIINKSVTSISKFVIIMTSSIHLSQISENRRSCSWSCKHAACCWKVVTGVEQLHPAWIGFLWNWASVSHQPSSKQIRPNQIYNKDLLDVCVNLLKFWIAVPLESQKSWKTPRSSCPPLLKKQEVSRLLKEINCTLVCDRQNSEPHSLLTFTIINKSNYQWHAWTNQYTKGFLQRTNKLNFQFQ